MIKLLTLTAAVGVAMLSGVGSASASETPMLTIRTSIYDTMGPGNAFSLYLGSVESQTVTIESGGQSQEVAVGPAVYDPESQSIKATVLTGTVGADGMIKVYGDASLIDYLDCEGLYARTADFSAMTNLEILNFDHNELESLDLSAFTKLQLISLSDNPFNVSPLHIGGNKPDLTILNIDIVGNMTADFNLSDYPSMVSFTAWANRSLNSVDASGCPKLIRLSIDSTDVSYLDISHNPQLSILNISDTRIRDIDLSGASELTQFYAMHQSSIVNPDIKLQSLDLTHCPKLVYLFVNGNELRELNVSSNPELMMLHCDHNLLRSLDVSANSNLVEVTCSYNYMDFATLPINPGTWNDYIWVQQPMEVDLSYPVGAKIDLSERVLREGTETFAIMMMQNSYDPDDKREVPESSYTYKDGVITLNEVPSDSVYMEFYNTAFPDNVLRTTMFKVKSEEDFGKPTKVLSFSSDHSDGEPVELFVAVAGASPQTPKTIYVDYGDGELLPATVTASTLPAAPNVAGPSKGYGSKEIYVDDGVYINGFGVHHRLYSIDVSPLPSLQDLALPGAGLYFIDLTRNYRLQSLDMSRNNLMMIDLEGVNNALNKQELTRINLSDNQLTEFGVPDNRTLVDLNLAGNSLTELSLRDADNLRRLDLSRNSLASINVNYSTGIEELNLASNKLTELVLPEAPTALKKVDISDNSFTFVNLPRPAQLGGAEFLFSPQAEIKVPTKGPGLNLSGEALTIEGHPTAFAWYKADGERCVEGTDYTITGGKTKFVNTEMGEVYCSMTNGAYPGLTLNTSLMEAAGMPTNLLATFVTPIGGQTAALSLASREGTPAIYFDWSGDGDLSQYLLKDTYTRYEAVTTKGAKVGVYTYEPEEKIGVFSITGVTMSEIDASAMKDLICLTLNQADLEGDKLVLPDAPELGELNLSGNRLSELDLTRYPKLWSLSLGSNKFTSFDLSKYPLLQLASLSDNMLTDITLDNPQLWLLDLSINNLKSVDLGKLPQMQQLGLSSNFLSSLDVSAMPGLRALSIVDNEFDFSTLPLRNALWVQYNYSRQADIKATAEGEGVVDLSFTSEAKDGTKTSYTWYTSRPEIDEEGNMLGEPLKVDVDYSVSEDGVTTFLGNYPQVVCVMTNLAFPELYLYTEPLTISGVGVESVVSPDDIRISVSGGEMTVRGDSDFATVLYRIDGVEVGRKELRDGEARYGGLSTGIYILATPAGAYRILVK